MITRKQLHDVLAEFEKHNWDDFSDMSNAIVDNLLNEWLSDADYYAPLISEDVYQFIHEEVESQLNYNQDTYDYIIDAQLFNIKEAVANGYSDSLAAVAHYYLEEEVSDLFAELQFWEMI